MSVDRLESFYCESPQLEASDLIDTSLVTTATGNKGYFTEKSKFSTDLK